MKLFVITGANRGIGFALAETITQHYGSKARYLLTVRNANRIENLERSLANTLGVELFTENVRFLYVDFAEKNSVTDYVNILSKYTAFIRESKDITLILNHGTLTFKNCFNVEELDLVYTYYQINLFSSWFFAAAFFRFIKEANIEEARLVLVNISSSAATQSNPGWVLYSAARSAKETVFRTIAKEYPDVKVLNYAPGACKTDMLGEAIMTDPNLEKRLSMFMMMFNDAL